MKRRFKLKIKGESPRSLFLAFALAHYNCEVYLYNITKNNPNNYEQIFSFSNFSKDLLIKFNIWNEFKDISYAFNSLYIKDNLVSEKLLISTENNLNTLGWTAKYSDIKALLIKKLNNFDNVNFISKNQLIDESLNFDYEFNFKSCDKNLYIFKNPFSIFNKIDEKILIFNAYLRGNIDKRLYKINTNNGLLILTPINKNLYQIIWNNISMHIQERSVSSKSFFLDNLTTLLPNDLKIDQIIGNISSQEINQISLTYKIKNKSIYFNENKFKIDTLNGYNFDIIIENILQIINLREKIKGRNNIIFNNLGFYYFLRRYYELMINFSISNTSINLFIFNNIFSLFLRKLLFTLIKRIKLFKIVFIRIFIKTSQNYLVK
tara:strand:- start:1513 stop:2643 length:1131 start_codon:yes stop_codon:yes gene_type:complete